MYISLDNVKYYAYTGTHDLADDLETVVFVHGTTMDHSVWSHQSRYFAYHGYNVVAVDLPGHKFSGGEPLSSIADMSKWLNGIISRCAGRAFHLVGHSMGSLVTLEAAAGYSNERAPLKSLSLVGFSYPMGVTPRLLDAARNHPSQAYSMMIEWSHTSRIGGEPIPGFWTRGMQMSMMENSRQDAVYNGLLACEHYRDGEAAFEKVDCPILFLCGRMDKMAPARLAKQEAERNENARIVILPDCGHSIMAESPDGVLGALKDFIGSHRHP
ncbi:MAG: alpha/beta hydrolase [Gammaproteobacteria bacterium]|nr:alpha/beta hydrolase [Gammaproteobacteria bacterium]